MSILNKIEVLDSLQIISITDDSGHTLIHRAAYDNTYRISEYLLNFYKQRLSSHLRQKEAERGTDLSPDNLNTETLNNIKREVRKSVS